MVSLQIAASFVANVTENVSKNQVLTESMWKRGTFLQLLTRNAIKGNLLDVGFRSILLQQ